MTVQCVRTLIKKLFVLDGTRQWSLLEVAILNITSLDVSRTCFPMGNMSQNNNYSDVSEI